MLCDVYNLELSSIGKETGSIPSKVVEVLFSSLISKRFEGLFGRHRGLCSRRLRRSERDAYYSY
jgi:hypothetical protein